MIMERITRMLMTLLLRVTIECEHEDASEVSDDGEEVLLVAVVMMMMMTRTATGMMMVTPYSSSWPS